MVEEHIYAVFVLAVQFRYTEPWTNAVLCTATVGVLSENYVSCD